eukprot:TRINITY_DN4829_c0_g1_i1.p1 TRINITY_DN4829_c0_g1~~TRINITY_DN4829_c0_g1_i1.p1  ORF type:complete len:273 (-),score=55.84 TRINITY_DN4829_c0_g1_i1:141-959(-)
MRFRATLKDAALFHKIILTIKQIEKGAILKLTPQKTSIIMIANVTDGFQVWSGVNTETIFDEVRLQSKSSNEISFHLNLDNLEKALKSCQNAHAVIVKLTKKNLGPCLQFSITSNVVGSLIIDHSVPVELLPAEKMASMKEPQLPDPEVYIFMPVLKHLRNVIDRMKNLDDYVTINATMGGELSFGVQTEMVEVTTYYKDLEHPKLPNRDNEGSDATATCKIDIKKLSRFLYCNMVNPQNVICCIVKDKALIFHVLLDDLFMSYYVPVILDG